MKGGRLYLSVMLFSYVQESNFGKNSPFDTSKAVLVATDFVAIDHA
jgi:hypothetical protein